MQMMEGHKARKRFGQNFLKDEYWIGRIAKAVDAEPGQAVVEIGPGQAALTRELIAGAGHVRAVEIDRDLAGWLKTQFTQQQLTLIEADALTLDWKKVAGNERLRVVGNLPYNISSPLLFHLMEAADVDIALFSSVVANAFAQRRKTLRNALSVLMSEDDIKAAGVNPQERAEKLPLEAFVALTKKAEALGVKPYIPGGIND